MYTEIYIKIFTVFPRLPKMDLLETFIKILMMNYATYYQCLLAS